MIFLNNKYSKWYFDICQHAKSQNRRKSKNTYFENHHIIPKCEPFCGSDDTENRVLLTYREHFVCHWLLTKMCITKIHKRKMGYALWSMSWKTKQHKRLISSWQYDLAKRAQIKEAKKPKTKEHIEAIREGIKKRDISGDKNGMFGRKHTEEARNKMKTVSKERNKGVGKNNSQYGKKYKWINNGIINKKCYTDNIPESFKLGRKPYTDSALKSYKEANTKRNRINGRFAKK